MGWRIIYACAGQGIEAARVRRVRGLYSIGYITGRMDVEGAGGETDAATCGSRLGGSHLIFDLTLLHHFLSIFHFISVHPVISRSANKIKISLRHSQTLQPSPRLRLVRHKHGPRMACLECSRRHQLSHHHQ